MSGDITTVWSIGVPRSVHDDLATRLPRLRWELFADSLAAREQLASPDDGPGGPMVVIAGYDADDVWSLRVCLSQIAARPSTELRAVLLLAEGPLSRFPVMLTDHPALQLVVDDPTAPAQLAARIDELARPSTHRQPKGIAL